MRASASCTRAVRGPRPETSRDCLAYRAAQVMTTVRVSRDRLDRQLVDRGLVESREKAQALIMAGGVLGDGRKAQKPGETVTAASHIELLARPRFVGRGGIKLQAALDHF